MNNIDFFYSKLAKNGRKSARSPNTKPTATRIAVMTRFSFTLLFTRKSTRIPTPEPEKSPDSIVPAVMSPSDARVARVTEAAQLGMRPNTAAMAWLMTGLPYIIAESDSSPMRKITAFMRRVTRRIKSPVVRV